MRPSGLEDPGILELDLLTWNVHGWVGLDLRRDPGRIFAWLRRLGADVVGLQEVEGRDWLGRLPGEYERLIPFFRLLMNLPLPSQPMHG